MRQILPLIANMLPDEYVRPVALLGRFWQIVWRTDGLTSIDLQELQRVFEEFMPSFLGAFGHLHSHKGLGYAKMLAVKNTARGIVYWGSAHTTTLSPFESYHKTATEGFDLTNRQRSKDQWVGQLCKYQQRLMTLSQFEFLWPKEAVRTNHHDCIFSKTATHEAVKLVDLEEQREGPPTPTWSEDYHAFALRRNLRSEIVDHSLYNKIRQFLGGGLERRVENLPGDYLSCIEVYERAWLVPGELSDARKSARERTMATSVQCGHDLAFEQQTGEHHVTWYGRVVLLFSLPAIKDCTEKTMPLAYVRMFAEPGVPGEPYPRDPATNLIKLKWESINGQPNYMVLSLEKALRRVMAVGTALPILTPLVECPRHKNALIEVSSSDTAGHVRIMLGSEVLEARWTIPPGHGSPVSYRVLGATNESIDASLAAATVGGAARCPRFLVPNPKKVSRHTVSSTDFLEGSEMLYITKR